MEIIRLSPDDWRIYRDLRLEALRESPESFGSTYAEMAQRPESFWQTRLADAARGEKSWLLFARENGRLVGMIGAFLIDGGASAEIISVYVIPEARRMGVARALMNAILDEVKKIPTVRKAYLGVNSEQLPALRLYEVFGFQQASSTRFLMGDGKYHLSILMEKPLL